MSGRGIHVTWSTTVVTKWKLGYKGNKLGPVVQRWVSANPGLKFNLLF
jgi:hypothetical protein